MTRVFIYGSCVTRDAEPWFKDFGLELIDYVARQSLISAFSPAVLSEYDLGVIQSSFQRRMTKGDITSNLMMAIKESKPDVILWDLCDERLGIAKPATGGVVTWSRNFKKEGSHTSPGNFSGPLKLGDQSHFELWSQAFGKFIGELTDMGMFQRLVLNATPWALRNESGERTSQSEKASEFNENVRRYLDLVASCGIRIVTVSDAKAISRSDHKWGPAPFHYVDSTYITMLEELQSS